MKNILIKGVFALTVLMFSQADAFGQHGRYGDTPEDSIRCLRSLMLYSDRYKQDNFEDALPYWRIVFKNYPRASRNIYIHGADIMSHMIETAETEEERKAYLDTAMMMFDQRIEYFGDKANVLGRKGTFYFQHNNNIEEAEPGYEALEEALRLSGNDPSVAVIVTYMNVTIGKYMAGIFDSEKVIEAYSYLTELIDNALEKSSSKQLLKARNMVESMFTDSGAADCDALIDLFTDQVNNSPEDYELLEKVNDLLNNAGCTDSDLYLSVTEKMHVLDPSPKSALNLSSMYSARNNDDKVIDYLKQAIDLQDDRMERANYYLELAIITNNVKQDKQLSRQYALQALNDNPALGRAHMHIGSLYASEDNCFDDDFKNSTVYWAAVDRFREAKRVDPSISEEADRMIETYSAYFPDNETIFFNGLTEGESYTVECWINETTRVRSR
ncbi:MAG: hypothetical protein R6U58_03660 [Bacteroidales bacterium]